MDLISFSVLLLALATAADVASAARARILDRRRGDGLTALCRRLRAGELRRDEFVERALDMEDR